MSDGRPDHGDKAPTIVEVARRAGVGVASVSRVLSNHPDASDGMRTRVLQAIDELGYVPNLMAQGLRRDESSTIGALFTDIANPVIAKMIEGAEHVLRDAGYSMLLTNQEGMAELGVRHLTVFRQRRVDGLIAMPAEESDAETNRLLASSSAPLVVIDRELPAAVRAAYVLSDHARGLGAAVRHIIDLGHHRVGLIEGPSVRPARMRRDVIVETLAAQGPQHRLEVVSVPRLNGDWGARGFSDLLDHPEPPTAIILAGNQLLEGVLRVARERGIGLGSDISLVGCDDTPLSEFHDPAISVVDRDAVAIGRAAAELLMQRLQGDGNAKDRVVLPTRYVPRGTSRRAG